MYTPGTSVRALVPYQAPPNGVAHRFKVLLRRLFAEADKLFLARRKLYLLLFSVACFGILLGSFIDQNFDLNLSRVLLLLKFHCFTVFFGSVTFFGCLLVFLSLASSSVLLGSFLSAGVDSAVQKVPVGLLFVFFFYFLLLAEGFFTWSRGKTGWRHMFLHREFLFLCLCFSFTIILL